MNLIRAAKLLAFVAVFHMLAPPAQAQVARQASDASLTAARQIAPACIGAWESPACLTAVSASNMVMLSNYGGVLQEKKLDAPTETLKQHCAASTAHGEKQFPAYAMTSAFVECVNTITDLTTQTSVPPDVDHFQLLLMAALCLSKDPRCAPMEKALAQYR